MLLFGVAHAQTPYSGAFRGVELGGGAGLAGDSLGPHIDVALRASTVVHLAGFRAGYRLAGPSDQPAHQARAAILAHPLFLFLVASDDWGAVLSSIYVTVGAGAWFADSAQFGWDWGAGLDVPLSNLTAESSWWLGAEWSRGCTPTGGPYEDDVLTVVGLRLGYRAHGF